MKMTGFLSQMRQFQGGERAKTDRNGQKRTETGKNGQKRTETDTAAFQWKAIDVKLQNFFSREKKFFASPGSHAFTKSAWGDRGRQICDRGWYDRGVRGGRGF